MTAQKVLEEIMQDEEFSEKLSTMEDPDEMAEAIQEQAKGYDISDADAELSEEDLAEVVGGMSRLAAHKIILDTLWDIAWKKKLRHNPKNIEAALKIADGDMKWLNKASWKLLGTGLKMLGLPYLAALIP